MAIELFTGLPGAGKTNHFVDRILKAVAEGREVFVCNLNGCDIPGVTIWDDPRRWEELPAGSLLAVDEAQKFWRATRSSEVPPEVLAMETHRHLGIDFLLTTQQPTYLLKHLRGLVGRHVHHLRRTKKTAQTWTWNQVVEDVESQTERERADGALYLYNQQAFRHYKSTEQDTHKPKIPRKAVFAAAVFATLAVGFYYLTGILSGDTTATEIATASGVLPEASHRMRRESEPMSTEAFVAALTPRVPTLPWSAPVFDERDVQSEPRLFCMSSEAGYDASGKWQPASESCITEQGTPYELEANAARMLAERGEPYNPYKRPPEEQPMQPTTAGVGAAHGDALNGTVMTAPQIGAYGDLGITANPGSAPR
jgi:zona occludens toxin